MMAGPIKIYLGGNHASWDADGWVWYLAARDEEYCAVRITPRDYIALRDQVGGDYMALVHALEQRAAAVAGEPHPVYRTLYEVRLDPPGDRLGIILDWLASLYYLEPESPEDAVEDWQATGTAREMVAKALTWPKQRFEGALLIGNAGVRYGPRDIEAIAAAHAIEPA